MNRILAGLWMVSLAALVSLLPALGPMFDHHFAERLPYHAHVGVAGDHEHGYRYLHSHDLSRTADWSPALYKLDTSPVILTLVVAADAELDNALRADPESALRIPDFEPDPLRSAYLSPPDRPPRRGPSASATL